MINFERFFQAMSDKTRQQILLLLQERDYCVGELVGKFELSQPTISKHLLVLKNADLVRDKREGQQVIYSLNQESFTGCCVEYFKHFNCLKHLFHIENG